MKTRRLHSFYKQALPCIALLCALMLSPLKLQADEVIKWVDENGKVHFSDRAPHNAKIKTEKLENTQAPTQGQSVEELAAQRMKTQIYKDRVRREQRNRKLAEKRKPAKAENNKEAIAAARQVSKKEALQHCRNTYKTNTKNRTQCFNEVAKNYQTK